MITKKLELINDWTKKTILIVEDNYANYFLVAEILEEYKIKIIWAKSGEEAINYCKDKIPFDLILMDYKLPCINGIDTIKQLLKINSDYKIIGLTSDNCEEEYMKAGAIDFMNKPIKEEKFIQKIREQLFKE